MDGVTERWPQYDRLGSVANQLDGQGNPVVTLWQDAYGNRVGNMSTGEWASTMSGRGLTTKEFDTDANLYYFWQRWYDPEVGRFVSKAPFASPIEHPYSISHNNPIFFNDPSGMIPLVIALPVIGGSVGAVAGCLGGLAYEQGGWIGDVGRRPDSLNDFTAKSFCSCIAGIPGGIVGGVIGLIPGVPGEILAAIGGGLTSGYADGKGWKCKCEEAVKDHLDNHPGVSLPENPIVGYPGF
jgi:RHS repeat-associated protein